MKQIDAMFGTIIAITAVIAIGCGCARPNEPTEDAHKPTTVATTEETAATETEPVETEAPVTEATEPPVTLYDVPLEARLQIHIISVAEAYDIDPAIIFGMAYKESNYNPDALGDGGSSHGLLQIQPRFQKERMERLGCDNLLDPFQNVSVGVDILANLIDYYDGNIEMALIAYNMGRGGAWNDCFSGGVYSNYYSQTIMKKAAELRGTTYVLQIG